MSNHPDDFRPAAFAARFNARSTRVNDAEARAEQAAETFAKTVWEAFAPALLFAPAENVVVTDAMISAGWAHIRTTKLLDWWYANEAARYETEVRGETYHHTTVLDLTPDEWEEDTKGWSLDEWREAVEGVGDVFGWSATSAGPQPPELPDFGPDELYAAE